MSYLIKPTHYQQLLDMKQTELGIKQIKEFFQQNLSSELRLRRVTAPLFVLTGMGINDDLNGVERAVSFPIKDLGDQRAEVVHSLAKWKRVTLADYTTEQFDLALYSGLYAAFYYMKACYPHLKETKGSVINFASGAGLFGNYGQCAYAAAKEGIRGLTRVAANEWGPDGINANIICPLAWTAQLENFQQAYPEAFEANVKMPPAGHYGDVEKEIGRVCVQLASPDFKYMNGETLTLEGGMGLRP